MFDNESNEDYVDKDNKLYLNTVDDGDAGQINTSVMGQLYQSKRLCYMCYLSAHQYLQTTNYAVVLKVTHVSQSAGFADCHARARADHYGLLWPHQLLRAVRDTTENLLGKSIMALTYSINNDYGNTLLTTIHNVLARKELG
ncbi:hypothetical protein MMC17_007942 [Xylographa soralifera]|nr:hypothetical protein [Xylographa soralifera]